MNRIEFHLFLTIFLQKRYKQFFELVRKEISKWLWFDRIDFQYETFTRDRWQKFRKGIQSKQLRFIPKSFTKPFRVNLKKVLDFVLCKSVKNESDSFRFYPGSQFALIHVNLSIRARFNLSPILNPNYSDIEFIRIENLFWIESD